MTNGAMTNVELEMITLIYALLERLDESDPRTAKLMAERLLFLICPLGSVPQQLSKPDSPGSLIATPPEALN